MAEIRVNATGALKLYDSDDSHYVGLQSAGTVSSNVTWTLPSADGSNGQFIKTDGSGALSFGSVSSALDDITTGDAASTLATSAGNITIDAQGNDTDIIFKGTDNSADITMLTLDGSEAGAATFNAGITATTGTFSGIVDADAGVTIDNITIDGTEIDLSSGDLTLDVAGDIIFDAGGNNFKFSSGGTQVLDIANSSSDVIIKPTVDAKDIIFQQYDGNEVMRINDSRKLQFYDDGGESITSDGSKLIIESGGTTFNLPTSDGSSGQAITTNGSGVLSFADAGGGKVLQAVTTYSTSKSTSTTHDSPVYWLNASLTPASSNSKVLVLGYLTMVLNDDNNRCGGILKRDSTVLKNSGSDHDDFFNGSFNHVNDSNASAVSLPFVYLDSPSTTSSTTYYLGSQANANQMHFNRSTSNNVGYTSSITLLEIGA